MQEELKKRVELTQAGETTVTLPNHEFDGDLLRIHARESVTIDFKQLRVKIDELIAREEKLVEALTSFYMDVETDYMINGEWVDNPTTMIKTNYEAIKATLKELDLI